MTGSSGEQRATLYRCIELGQGSLELLLEGGVRTGEYGGQRRWAETGTHLRGQVPCHQQAGLLATHRGRTEKRVRGETNNGAGCFLIG